MENAHEAASKVDSGQFVDGESSWKMKREKINAIN